MTFKEAQEKLVTVARKYGRDYTSIKYEVTRMEYLRTEASVCTGCTLYVDGFDGSFTAVTWEEAFRRLEKWVSEKGIQPVNGITVETQAPE